jgi:hypothetical protein
MKNKLILLLVLLIPSLCFGNTSKELAQKGLLFYEAFECCHIAQIAGDTNESRRLLAIGLRDGRIFIDAVKKKKITEKDIDENVPMIVMWSITSQSTDFILGTIYVEAGRNALKNVFGSYEKFLKGGNEKSLQKMLAEEALRKRNAWLIK